ncbi:MAG TPA: hypothetical protein VGR59_05435 [Gemmatimonadaceae bacterium]|nr:hypothetical protein [Gemmatimonadaceae bacterium]
MLFAGLEESLAAIEDLITRAGRAESDGLTRYQSDLPAGFGGAIRPVLTELRARVTRLAAELDLRGQSRSAAHSIRAILVAEMIRLEDSTSAQLRGYGTVDPRVADVIEPELRALHTLLASMQGRLATPRAGGVR